MIFDAIRKWFGSDGGSSANGGNVADGGMISCEDALSRLYEFLDGELDDLTRDQVRAHYEVCRRCYPHLAAERAFKAALQRAMEGRRAPPELRHRVLDLLGEVTE